MFLQLCLWCQCIQPREPCDQTLDYTILSWWSYEDVHHYPKGLWRIYELYPGNPNLESIAILFHFKFETDVFHFTIWSKSASLRLHTSSCCQRGGSWFAGKSWGCNPSGVQRAACSVQCAVSSLQCVPLCCEVYCAMHNAQCAYNVLFR